jgi:hypothetical protein
VAQLTPSVVYQLARSVGLDPAQAATATAIAMAESGLRTDAVGDAGIQTATWGPSIGLWQIRSLKADRGTGRARDADRLTDPQHNARAMYEISGGGTNWRPWSVFTSGKYRDYAADVVKGNLGQLADAGVVDAVGSPAEALAAVNPFTGWQDDAAAIGLKVAVTVAALGLVVAGAWRAVSAGPPRRRPGAPTSWARSSRTCAGPPRRSAPATTWPRCWAGARRRGT